MQFTKIKNLNGTNKITHEKLNSREMMYCGNDYMTFVHHWVCFHFIH